MVGKLVEEAGGPKMFIDRLEEQLIEGVASLDEVVGCTAEEIALIELTYKRRLPEVYKAFLAKMGRSAGKLFEDTEAYYPALLGFRARAEELLLAEEGRLSLPDDAIVFLLHQGYVFAFFSGSDDDPIVQFYEEGTGEISTYGKRLSDILATETESYVAFDGQIRQGLVRQ